MEGARRTVRCAVYTRKSTEKGLEQEFNSLDAQRASGEAYIKAREMDGWRLIPEHYDDGGYSGGNTNRPAFQRLLADVRAGKIDVIVCYKLDRLSRRLFDFADIFQLLERYNVSFTCVTQEFNSSTSTGRMMINIMMSFAQYEREVTSERIRDKLRASRQKGFWPGGVVPFGYVRSNKLLKPDPATSENVQRIFDTFVESGGRMKRAIRRLNEQGILRFPDKGVRWATPSLRNLLHNVVYIGKIKIGDDLFPGVHRPLVTQESWDRAQKLLAEASCEQPEERRKGNPALLVGLLRCGTCGSLMGYRWSRKSKTGVKYGYYMDVRDSKRGLSSCPVRHVSAQAIEPVVEGEVMKVLKTPTMIRLVADAMRCSAYEVERLLEDPELFWRNIQPDDKRRLMKLLVHSVFVFAENVEIRIRTEGYEQLIEEVRNVHLEG